MPTCPGCEKHLPYDQLASHQMYCADVWGEHAADAEAFERFERLLDALDARVRAIETDDRDGDDPERAARR